MKKNLIALLLAVVMASSSVGVVPVVAAETNAPETVAVEESVADGENAAEEASVEGNTTVDETEVTNEAATDDKSLNSVFSDNNDGSTIYINRKDIPAPVTETALFVEDNLPENCFLLDFGTDDNVYFS